MRGAIPPLHQHAFMVWCSKMYRGKFSFTFLPVILWLSTCAFPMRPLKVVAIDDGLGEGVVDYYYSVRHFRSISQEVLDKRNSFS
jgi:hypothetical protein